MGEKKERGKEKKKKIRKIREISIRNTMVDVWKPKQNFS